MRWASETNRVVSTASDGGHFSQFLKIVETTIETAAEAADRVVKPIRHADVTQFADAGGPIVHLTGPANVDLGRGPRPAEPHRAENDVRVVVVSAVRRMIDRVLAGPADAALQ